MKKKKLKKYIKEYKKCVKKWQDLYFEMRDKYCFDMGRLTGGYELINKQMGDFNGNKKFNKI